MRACPEMGHSIMRSGKSLLLALFRFWGVLVKGVELKKEVVLIRLLLNKNLSE